MATTTTKMMMYSPLQTNILAYLCKCPRGALVTMQGIMMHIPRHRITVLQSLRSLERDGFVTSKLKVPGFAKSPRVYQVTENGRKAHKHLRALEKLTRDERDKM